MAATKSKKSNNNSRAKYGTCIPKGDDLLPGIETKVLQKMHTDMSGRKDVGKEVLILKVTIKWRAGLGVSEIARQLELPRSTVRDWLIRLRDRGLNGIHDTPAPNHKPILAGVAFIVIGVWLSHSPQAYGFESALWQTSMLRKMILNRLGIDVKPRTIRNTLYRMGLSMRMPREIPNKSASTEERQAFITKTEARINSLSKDGYTFFYEDEMTMRLGVATSKGWLPRGGRETIPTTFSKRSLKVFGALGRNILHIMPAHSTKSSVFKIFLEALRQKYGKVVFVTDNATSHKSKLIQDYLKLAGGDVVLIYLPAYTPQLNPIEIQWRIIKARLAGRYFATEDEMEDSIIRLVESGEVQPVQVTSLPMV